MAAQADDMCLDAESAVVPGVELVESQRGPELPVLVAGEHCGDAAPDGRTVSVGGDVQVPVSGVGGPPGEHVGPGEDEGPAWPR